MSSVPYALSAAVVLAAIGVTPGFAQATAPTRHMLIQYRPASGGYCADTMPRDALFRPAEGRCSAEPGWTQQRLVMARR